MIRQQFLIETHSQQRYSYTVPTSQRSARGNLPIKRRDAAPFSEASAWREVAGGWQPLFAGFRGAGFSVEWHDFFTKRELDWAASFHPGCVELCLNLNGHGFVEGCGRRTEFAPDTAGFYCHRGEPLTAKRLPNQQHRFLTVEFSCTFLAKHLAGLETTLHPLVDAAIKDCQCKLVAGSTVRLNASQQEMIATL